MPRSLRRLIRQIQQQGEEIRQLTTQVKGQREEIRQLRADGRRRFIRWLIREAPANLVVTLFGGWLLYWWQQGVPLNAPARQDVRRGEDVEFNARRRHDVRSGPQDVRVSGISRHRTRGEARVVVVPAADRAVQPPA